MDDLAGLYAALPTAFDDAFAYDGRAQAALARHALDLGMEGLFVGGSTAETHSLTLEERRAGLKDVAQAAAGRARLVAHVGAMREDDAMALTATAGELGYHAVASTPPFYSPYGQSDRRQYFERLVAASPVPVFLYHIPSLTGLDLGHEELLDILSIDGICGMKLSSSDLMLVQKIKAQMPERLVLFGSDELLGLALCAGADGGVGSTYNLFGRDIVAMRDAVRDNDLGAMRRLQARINAGIDVLVDGGVFQNLKLGLAAMGVPCGPTRPPLMMPPAGEAARRQERLRPFLG